MDTRCISHSARSSELESHGLGIVDAVPQPVYGGAVRVFARAGAAPERSVDSAWRWSIRPGSAGPRASLHSPSRSRAQRDLIPRLQATWAAGRRIAGYGAPDRAITFLNALEIGPDLLPFVVDRAVSKHGRLIPGVLIPIFAPEALTADPPNEVLILTWNLVPEIRAALAPLVAGGTRLLVAIPDLADVTVEDEPARPADPGRTVR